ncbi:hypothetical protein [Coleofasciculus sp. FACHB-712]|nr:hypothetical protein [Coleofasciculus sp. FACHB-712]
MNIGSSPLLTDERSPPLYKAIALLNSQTVPRRASASIGLKS